MPRFKRRVTEALDLTKVAGENPEFAERLAVLTGDLTFSEVMGLPERVAAVEVALESLHTSGGEADLTPVWDEIIALRAMDADNAVRITALEQAPTPTNDEVDLTPVWAKLNELDVTKLTESDLGSFAAAYGEELDLLHTTDNAIMERMDALDGSRITAEQADAIALARVEALHVAIAPKFDERPTHQQVTNALLTFDSMTREDEALRVKQIVNASVGPLDARLVAVESAQASTEDDEVMQEALAQIINVEGRAGTALEQSSAAQQGVAALATRVDARNLEYDAQMAALTSQVSATGAFATTLETRVVGWFSPLKSLTRNAFSNTAWTAEENPISRSKTASDFRQLQANVDQLYPGLHAAVGPVPAGELKPIWAADVGWTNHWLRASLLDLDNRHTDGISNLSVDMDELNAGLSGIFQLDAGALSGTPLGTFVSNQNALFNWTTTNPAFTSSKVYGIIKYLNAMMILDYTNSSFAASNMARFLKNINYLWTDSRADLTASPIGVWMNNVDAGIQQLWTAVASASTGELALPTFAATPEAMISTVWNGIKARFSMTAADFTGTPLYTYLNEQKSILTTLNNTTIPVLAGNINTLQTLIDGAKADVDKLVAGVNVPGSLSNVQAALTGMIDDAIAAADMNIADLQAQLDGINPFNPAVLENIRSGLGLPTDFNMLSESFLATPLGTWLAGLKTEMIESGAALKDGFYDVESTLLSIAYEFDPTKTSAIRNFKNGLANLSNRLIITDTGATGIVTHPLSALNAVRDIHQIVQALYAMFEHLLFHFSHLAPDFNIIKTQFDSITRGFNTDFGAVI